MTTLPPERTLRHKLTTLDRAPGPSSKHSKGAPAGRRAGRRPAAFLSGSVLQRADGFAPLNNGVAGRVRRSGSLWSFGHQTTPGVLGDESLCRPSDPQSLRVSVGRVRSLFASNKVSLSRSPRSSTPAPSD